MIYFRIFTKTNPLFLLLQPFYCTLFLYFLTTSVDLYNLPLLVFKLKPTYALALLFSSLFFLVFKTLYLPYNFTLLNIAILLSMGISTFNSVNPTACIGFILLMIFSFIFYFLIPYTLFYYIEASRLLKIYFNSFFCLGLYASFQVILSLAGIFLPGVSQFIFQIARGQAFAYEPSYYALFMAPFTIFYTTKFILKSPKERRWSHIIWPNIFFLISTSTGCLFAYLIYFIHLIFLNSLKIIKIRLTSLFFKCTFILITLLGALWVMNKNLVTAGLLKFFFSGASHVSLTTRWKGIVDYWNIFLENPLFGVGLGAAPFYYAQKEGLANLSTTEILVTCCPTNVLTEIFASLGLLGASLFAIFIFLLMKTFRSAYQNPNLSLEERENLIAMALSVSVTLIMLQCNQTITRPYLWVHIGLFVGYARTLYSRLNRP